MTHALMAAVFLAALGAPAPTSESTNADENLLNALFGKGTCDFDQWCLPAPAYFAKKAAWLDCQDTQYWCSRGRGIDSGAATLIATSLKSASPRFQHIVMKKAAAAVSPFAAFIEAQHKELHSVTGVERSHLVESWLWDALVTEEGATRASQDEFLYSRALFFDGRLGGLLALTIREGSFDPEVLGEQKFKRWLSRVPDAKVVVDEPGRKMFVVATTSELALVQVRGIRDYRGSRVEVLRLALSQQAIDELRTPALAIVPRRWVEEHGREIGAATPEDVYEYELALAKKLFDSDPATALGHVEPLLFLGVRAQEAVDLRDRLLKKIQDDALAKARRDLAQRAQAERDAARDAKRKAALEATQRQRRAELLAGVDQSATVEAAVFDSSAVNGKTVLWTGWALRALDDKTYLVSYDGHLFVAALEKTLDGPGLIALKGTCAGTYLITDGIRVLKVPFVSGRTVEFAWNAADDAAPPRAEISRARVPDELLGALLGRPISSLKNARRTSEWRDRTWHEIQNPVPSLGDVTTSSVVVEAVDGSIVAVSFYANERDLGRCIRYVQSVLGPPTQTLGSRTTWTLKGSYVEISNGGKHPLTLVRVGLDE